MTKTYVLQMTEEELEKIKDVLKICKTELEQISTEISQPELEKVTKLLKN